MAWKARKTFLAGFWGLVLFLLYSLSRRNYLLFHSIIEFLAILTGFTMFLFAMTASSVSRNTVVQKLGWLYLGVASIDTLHTLSYKGMGVFPGYTANLPTQFWILGRLVEFGGLAVIVLWPRHVSIGALALMVFSAAIAGSSTIFLGYFPDCFLEGKGLTLFKVVSEYVMIALLFTLLIQVQRDRDEDMLPFRKPISWALVLSALAEFSFTLYTDVYGFFNMLGHLFRFISYFVLLEGIVVESIRKPFDALLFEVQQEKNQLEEIAKRDALTGVFNRHFFNEWIKEHAQGLSSLGLTSTLVFLDVDNLKVINDTYGHLTGDQVLSFVARILRENLRKDVLIARYGGDEFVVVFPKTRASEACIAMERVQCSMANQSEFSFPISFSFGVSEFRNLDEAEKILLQADQEMYAMKKARLRM